MDYRDNRQRWTESHQVVHFYAGQWCTFTPALTDDYAASFTLKGVRHGACNAHNLRELQALIDIEKEDWAKSMHRLLERAHRATRFSRENARDVPASLVARISWAWARILDHAIAFHEAQPPLRTGKRGRKKRCCHGNWLVSAAGRCPYLC